MNKNKLWYETINYKLLNYLYDNKKIKVIEEDVENAFNATNRNTRQTTLDSDDILEAFDSQFKPRQRVALQHTPAIQISYNSIDWDDIDKNHLLFPCYDATRLPIGQRPEHIKNCSKCQEMIREMDKIYLEGNKWLS